MIPTGLLPWLLLPLRGEISLYPQIIHTLHIVSNAHALVKDALLGYLFSVVSVPLNLLFVFCGYPLCTLHLNVYKIIP